MNKSKITIALLLFVFVCTPTKNTEPVAPSMITVNFVPTQYRYNDFLIYADSQLVYTLSIHAVVQPSQGYVPNIVGDTSSYWNHCYYLKIKNGAIIFCVYGTAKSQDTIASDNMTWRPFN